MNAYTRAILAEHPEALEIVESDDFKGWVLRQAPMVARAIYGEPDGRGGTVADVVQVLNEYKAAVGYGKKIIPQPSFTREQIASMPMEEFAAREKDIDMALERGLIR